jgi:chromosome segregation ATPase
MAYKITQHRRGTYEEWLELDTIPLEGELVIVEFANNICKCKIGNGVSRFTELPYITDWVTRELLNKIEALEHLTNDNLSTAVSELYQKIEDSITEQASSILTLRSDMDTQYNKLTNSVKSLSDDLTKIDGVVKTLVEPAVGELDAKYSEELAQIVQQQERDKKAFTLALDTVANNLQDSVEVALNQSSADFVDRLDKAKTEVVADYSVKLAKTDTYVRNEINAINDTLQQHTGTLEAIQTDINSLTNELNEQVNQRIELSEAKTNSNIKEVLASLNNLNTIVEQLQQESNNIVEDTPAVFSVRNLPESSESDNAILVEQLDELFRKIALLEEGTSVTATEIQNINSELNRLTTSVTNLSNQQKENVARLVTTVNALDTKIGRVDTATNELINSHHTAVNTELSKLTSAYTLLYQTIYKIQDSLLQKIDNLEGSLHIELSDDITRILGNVAELRDNFSTTINQAQSDLVETISTTKAELDKQIDELKEAHETRLSKNERTLTTLSASTSAMQANLSGAVEKLTADVLNNTVDITNNKLALSQVSSELNTKVALIDTELETLNSKLDNKVIETETKLQVQIDSTNTTIQQQANILVNVQDNINDLAEDLDNRITTKVLTYKDTTDKSILKIQEEIRQIENTIKDLPEKLGDCTVEQDSLNAIISELSTLAISVQSLESNQVSSEADRRLLKDELSKLASLLNGIIDAQKADINELNRLISSVETKLSKADTAISNTLNANINIINDEIAGLDARYLLLYQTVYKLHDTLLSAMADLQTETQATVNSRLAELDKRLKDSEDNLSTELTEANTMLTESIATAKTDILTELSRIDTYNKAKIKVNEKSIEDLTEVVQADKKELLAELAEHTLDIASNTNRIGANRTLISEATDTIKDHVTATENTIKLFNTNLKAQNARIDNLIAFNPDLFKPTDDDSELEKKINDLTKEIYDIRSGYDGEIYGSANSAIHAIGNNLQALKNSLSQYINTQAISGLYYDINGDVGVGQPYMLYLMAGTDIITESGIQIIGGAGGTGTGGGASSLKISYITPQEVKVTSTDKDVKLYFRFEGEDSSGDTIRTASATWRVDGVVVERNTVTYGENYFDVTDYITTGTIKVHVTVTDDNGGTVTKSWNVQQIELKIESDFFDQDSYPVGEKIPFTFVPTGAINKTARFILDGKELTSPNEYPIYLDATKSGTSELCELPALSYGAHLLEVYLEATLNDGTVLPSNHIFKDIICFDNTDKTRPPVIGTSTQTLNVTQYSTTNIVYTVYDPNTDTPIVDIEVDGVKVYEDYEVIPNEKYNYTPTAVFSYVATTAGNHEIKILCGSAKPKVIKVAVEDLGITITPITANLAFDFNPAGRSRGDRTWNYSGVSLTASDNFDWTNGGFIPDDPDGPCFCIKAGSSAIIDYKLFADDAKNNGKEVKLVFKTKNVSKPDAVFLSCLDNKTDPTRIGLEMSVQGAKVYGQTDNLELVYSEDDIIELDFNISKYSAKEGALNVVMGYEDGVPSRPMIYDNSFSFTHSAAKAQPITLGSPDCDLYIYRFKAYKAALSNDNILNNFIADARSTAEMVARYNRNKIYDENGKLTAESLADACPWLRVIKIAAPRFTSSKSDNIANTTIQQIYRQGRTSDNWVAYDAVHSGQGTSSNNYGAAGRNLDLKVRIVEDDDGNPINTEPYFLLANNEVTDKVSLTDTSIPVDYFNIKVNIASSNNLTNAILANRYNRFNPYKRPYIRDEKEASLIPYIKDTMEFYNCVVFIKETDPDLTTHREFADNDWHFYAIGNIGDSKKTDKTRATDPSDSLECCVEIMDVGLPLSAFPRDTMINAMSYTIDETSGEKVYTWAKNENLDKLYERAYTLTEDTSINLNKTYYIELEGKKVNAMEYSIVEVNEYLWAKNENLGILYELIDNEYILTSDTEIDLTKTYYRAVEELDDNGIATGTVTYHDAMDYTTKEIKQYTWAKDENLSLLYEMTYHLTSDTEINLNKIYYIDILEHDDFSEDYTYGWRYRANKKNTEQCKQAWIDFYRFVTTSTDEEFKMYLKYYFAVDSALYYYLFTTRYCMVDNRAKNTFWHYGKSFDKDGNNTIYAYPEDIEIKNAVGEVLFSAKAGDAIRKWDLCWDYDNDTSLGLNNYGKQVYRYGLEDTDYDDAGEEVFRQSDSLFFCRIRDLFADELRSRYQTLESANAWDANAFLNECDAWQEQFPEDLWRIDIERKYIRTYSKSFIDGKGDEQFLRDMSNGRMKYQRRQWERNQEQYMASKYQTDFALGDAHHVNFRVGRPSGDLVVAPNYSFTLTPYSYIYLNVKYGGASPISVRAKPNEAITVPYSGKSADIINVGSAAAISDFGDLSALYPRTATMSNAARIKALTLGNSTAGYQNPIFQRLTTGSNDLLEVLNLTNIVSYVGALDLHKLINLKKLHAFGTSLNSITFAEGGKLDYVELPAVNNITLRRLKYLATNNIKLATYNNVIDLIIEGCPNINQHSLLTNCQNVQRIRLDDINFGTKTYSYFSNIITDNETGLPKETGLFRLRGLTATGEETANAQITGTVHFESLNGDQFNELRERYPNLQITYGTLNSTIKFMDTINEGDEGTRVISSQSFERAQTDPIDCRDSAPKSVTERIPSIEFTYYLFGWSTNPYEPPVDYNDMSASVAATAEQADFKKYNEDMLMDIEGDRTFYPVFKAVRNEYEVRFINPTTDPVEETIIKVPYGKLAEFPGETPQKGDVPNGYEDLYAFIGWYPTDLTVLGPEQEYVAQFDIKDFDYDGVDDDDTDPGYTLGINDVEFDTSKKTLIRNKNLWNSVIKVPERFNGTDVNYLGEHSFQIYNSTTSAYTGNTKLKIVFLPNTLKGIQSYAFHASPALFKVDLPEGIESIGAQAFSTCSTLPEINIPKTVSYIADRAFELCPNLLQFKVADGNEKYFTLADNKILVDTSGKLIQGLKNSTITEEMSDQISSLSPYCFAEKTISSGSIFIPKNVTAIPSNAFNGCTNLSTIILPSDSELTRLDSTCFWKCPITEIALPKKLEIISTYAFDSTKLTNITIPSKVNTIFNRAFGFISTLETVTFEGCPETITALAFANAGSGTITFNVPWTKAADEARAAAGKPRAPWGADKDDSTGTTRDRTDGTKIIINYSDCTEVIQC